MDAQSLFSLITLAAVRPLVGLLPLVLVVLALKRLVPRMRGSAGEARIGRVLEQLFSVVRHDLILPDGRGGWTQIDHLALTPAGLLVVESKAYRGLIFGRKGEATWTQVLGRRRYTFQNPLRQNFAHVQALKALGLGVPVLERVVFTNTARFPKGLPEGVSRLATLAEDLEPYREGVVSDALHQAWQQLDGAIRTDRAARRAHRAGLERRFGADDRLSPGLLLLAAAGVLVGGLWLTAGQLGPEVSALRRQPPLMPAPAASASRPASALSPTSVSPPPLSSRPQPRGSTVSVAVAEPRISLQWTERDGGARESEDCKLAIAAVLMANTPENRHRRVRVCGTSAMP
ncbi:NERD domain-containing protein [Thiorhodococcus mannitoliphagus]|uniref:NERD domain-containing protein n=1 Tax=Thiorhodococcus mannitoliphagus TaxID=329406 RepID=A0A6P1DPF4_9GAMM|nr:nuclease-related domain-containing protein [Thiorhodococcus mannitoliphagus]NEX19878.1 NERD domain-containing protein [Thiorhodococcus mannitoliphagus]